VLAGSIASFEPTGQGDKRSGDGTPHGMPARGSGAPPCQRRFVAVHLRLNFGEELVMRLWFIVDGTKKVVPYSVLTRLFLRLPATSRV
jgi:hypothetical protein